MGKSGDASETPKPRDTRDERLKAALKQNLQRRKQQARARKAGDKSGKAG